MFYNCIDLPRTCEWKVHETLKIVSLFSSKARMTSLISGGLNPLDIEDRALLHSVKHI